MPAALNIAGGLSSGRRCVSAITDRLAGTVPCHDLLHLLKQRILAPRPRTSESMVSCYSPNRCWCTRTCGRIRHSSHVRSATPAAPLFVFACGGTGGHVTPALAVADELQSAAPTCQVKFFGDARGPEAAIVSKHGYNLEDMPNTAFHRPLLDIRNIWRALRMLLQVAQHMLKLRVLRPAAVIGTGCYAAFPACLAAALCGMPLFLIEPNAVPGLANKLLAPLSTAVFISFPSAGTMLPKDKIFMSGTPVRKTFGATSKKTARDTLQFDCHEQLLTVVGGSSGSDQLSYAMMSIIPSLLHVFPTLHIHHQHSADITAELTLEAHASRRYLETTFFDNMAVQLAGSDLVLSRAGALTCAEMLHTGVPSVLWPLATSADGHQLKNAQAMVNLGASVLFTEPNNYEPPCSALLFECLNRLLANRATLSKLAAPESTCSQDAACTIACEIMRGITVEKGS